MTRHTTSHRILLALLAVAVASAVSVALASAAAPTEAAARAALERYRGFTLQTNHDAIAAMMAEDAEVSHGAAAPTLGRQNILTLLKSFAAFKVASHEMTVSKVTVGEASTVVAGKYKQVVTPPDGQTLTVSGTFEATFRLAPDGSVLIAKMHTE
jgi:ketosteroid isomerase-like protein